MLSRIQSSRAAYGALTALGAALPAFAGGGPVPPYAVSLLQAYETVPLLSVGDRIPVTGQFGTEYQMVGIPDGLGAHAGPGALVTIYLNHELTQNTLSEPFVGGPLNRGALVTKLLVTRAGVVVSADRAYDFVYLDDTLVGPAADTTNTTRGFARFCSASLAGRAEGFDRPIYLANEESTGASTFDGLGGLAVAIFDGEAHGLTALGRFAWENALVQSNSGQRTVIMSMEDGPTSQDPAQNNSQLYMYVGMKDFSPGATVLERNGLVGGTLYAFRSFDPSRNSELGFQTGTIAGEWVALPPAGPLTDVQLEAATDAAGAMVFARPEDGAFNPRNKDNFFFVTTGGAAGANVLGRLYSLELNPVDPTLPAQLTVVYNADQVIANGGDTAISPDNIGIDHQKLMVQEDGTAESRPVMASKNRDGSIWSFNLTGSSGVSSIGRRVVELDPPGRDGIAVGPGVWETSGIISTNGLFGPGTWLFDVQAHGPTSAPAPNTVEDGQLLLFRRRQAP